MLHQKAVHMTASVHRHHPKELLAIRVPSTHDTLVFAPRLRVR